MRKSATFYGRIVDGILKLGNLKSFNSFLADMSGNVQVTVEPFRDTRSTQLNRWYWVAIITPIEDFTGHEKEEIHAFFKTLFLKHRFEMGGVVQDTAQSTTVLSTEEFLAYAEKCRVWAIEHFPKIVFEGFEEYQK